MAVTTDIETRALGTSALPSLPQVAVHLIELSRDPDTTIRDISECLSADPALVQRILKTVNSPLYGMRHKVSTISQAVVLLGFNVVRNIVLSVSVFETFSQDSKAEEFDKYRFWEHSIACGATTRAISKHLGVKDPEEAFVGGLLHDIGKLVLDQFLTEEFLKVLQLVKEKEIPILEAEQEVLETTHPQIGRFLAQKWNLPQALEEAIGFHHNPASAETELKLVSAVHLADVIVKGMGIGYSGDDLVPQINKRIWEGLKLNLNLVGSWLKEIGDEVEKASSFLSLLKE